MLGGPSFRYFTERAKARQLWRLCVRTAYRSPHRKELLEWAKAEFEMSRKETDPDKIKYLVSEGLKRVRGMAQMF